MQNQSKSRLVSLLSWKAHNLKMYFTVISWSLGTIARIKLLKNGSWKKNKPKKDKKTAVKGKKAKALERIWIPSVFAWETFPWNAWAQFGPNKERILA